MPLPEVFRFPETLMNSPNNRREFDAISHEPSLVCNNRVDEPQFEFKNTSHLQLQFG